MDLLDARLKEPEGERDRFWRMSARYPDAWTPPVFRAAATPVARVFLGFSRFPAARAFVDPEGEATVRWNDMRFAGGLFSLASPRRPDPFTVTVRLAPDGSIGSSSSADDEGAARTSLAEDFRLEPPQRRAALPRVGGQAGLPAGLRRETSRDPNSIRSATCGSRRPRLQPCSTTRPWRPTSTCSASATSSSGPSSDSSMAMLDELGRRHRRESRILGRRGDRAPRDDGRDGTVGFDMADAAAQLVVAAQGDERASRPPPARRSDRSRAAAAPARCVGDRLPRDAKQRRSLVVATS